MVLILVVMDVALGRMEASGQGYKCIVLILVVMDVALGQSRDELKILIELCLNPCCNGCRTWAH